ncbi:MAG: CoA transferase [Candidatus Tectomicrobia bacterium]
MNQRALDLTTGVGAAYPTKLLCEVGWDVVKVEPQAGDPLRRAASRWGGGIGGAFVYVNYGKRSVTVDHVTLGALAAQADVVVGDFTPHGCAEADLPPDLYDQLSPRAVLASVSAFGLSGPKAPWTSGDLILQAASGLMFLTGEADQPPMQLPPYAAAMTGGLAAASAVMAAVRSHRLDSQSRRLDLSMMEAMTALIHGQVSQYLQSGEVVRREQRIKQALRMVPSSDGYIYCAPGAVASVRMEGIAQLLDEPRLAQERFQTAEGRMQNWEAYLELFVSPFAAKTAKQWFEEAEALHLTFTLVQTVDELFQCPQLVARQFMRQVPGPDGTSVAIPGRPFTMERMAPVCRPAPRTPGQDTDAVIAAWLA